MLTRTRHLSLLCARLIQLMSSYPISLGTILISSSQLHVGLPSCYFPPPRLPHQNTAHISVSPVREYVPHHLLELVTYIKST